MRIVIPLAAAALVSACASGSGTAVQRMSADVATASRVSEVRVVQAPANVSADFQNIFKAKAEQKLATCATGARPVRLEANIHTFKRANPAMTWLLADANQIKGTVKLVDAANGQVLGDYAVSRSFAASGLIGVALMSQAEEQMSDGFAEEICKAVFRAKK